MMALGKMGSYLVVALLVLTFSACATTASKNQSERPSWIDAPPSSGLTAAASASYEIFGEAKARENAILKALSMIALQKSSEVDINGKVDHISRFSSNNGSAGTLSESASVSVKTNIGGSEIPVNATISAYWKDKKRKRVWVLMEEK